MYRNDLTIAHRARLVPLQLRQHSQRQAGGRPREHELRRVVDALLYGLNTRQWRRLPSGFTPWRAVHDQFVAGWIEVLKFASKQTQIAVPDVAKDWQYCSSRDFNLSYTLAIIGLPLSCSAQSPRLFAAWAEV